MTDDGSENFSVKLRFFAGLGRRRLFVDLAHVDDVSAPLPRIVRYEVVGNIYGDRAIAYRATV